MSHQEVSIETLVEAGASFVEIVECMRKENHHLRPIDVLTQFQERLGIHFTKTREILEFYDSQMEPIGDVCDINERGKEILNSRRK